MDWQPIETAPKNDNGEPKMLLVSKSGFISVGYWEPQGKWRGCWHDGYHALHPTHWMPLPQPPNTDK